MLTTEVDAVKFSWLLDACENMSENVDNNRKQENESNTDTFMGWSDSASPVNLSLGVELNGIISSIIIIKDFLDPDLLLETAQT